MGARSSYPDYNYMFVDAAFDVFTRRDGNPAFLGRSEPCEASAQLRGHVLSYLHAQQSSSLNSHLTKTRLNDAPRFCDMQYQKPEI